MTDAPDVQLGASTAEDRIQLERYKYILKQMHFLNGNVHRYLTLFEKLATVIVASAAAVFLSWRKLEIDAATARAAIQALLALFITLAFFSALSVLAGIFSWLDYRNEEVALLDDLVRQGFRSRPRPKNFLRWYETYVILLMIVISLAGYVFVQQLVLPSIK